jgi:hypothetical protein
MAVGSDATASNGQYVNITSATTASTVTWTINNTADSGSYTIGFGYKLAYGIPKGQYININGVRAFELMFNGTSQTVWYQKDTIVTLLNGTNTIQMQMNWAWMHLDYLAVPRNIVTAVDDKFHIPVRFSLEQNYPNPFNPSTTIRYSLLHTGYIRLLVYDVLGRQVALLVDKRQDAGVYETSFDASFLPSGVYFLRMQAGDFMKTRKMVLLK